MVRGGFTLIELLVVIAIIIVLIGILLPGLGKSRDAARRIICASSQKQVVTALSTYMNANKEMVPREGNYDLNNPAWNRLYLSWAVALRPFIDGTVDPAKDPNDLLAGAWYYRDPARKADRHNVHFVANSFPFVEPGVVDIANTRASEGYRFRRGLTPLERIKLPDTTLYLTEFGDDRSGVVQALVDSVGNSDAEKAQMYDVWDPLHLQEGSASGMLSLRVGLKRHGSNANAAFMDGHVAALPSGKLADVRTWDDHDYGSRVSPLFATINGNGN